MHCVLCGSAEIVYIGEVAHLEKIDMGRRLIVDIYECPNCSMKCWEEDLEGEITCEAR